jgi:hypothetical protein
MGNLGVKNNPTEMDKFPVSVNQEAVMYPLFSYRSYLCQLYSILLSFYVLMS